jgi:carbonic anhydrase
MKTIRCTAALLTMLVLSACHNASPGDSAPRMRETPLDVLMWGNQRFVEGHALHSNQSVDRRTEVVTGQHPIAIIVGCSDSRVPPEIVFDQGLGDLFVVRVAGNIVDDQAIGSIEYAVEHLHATLIVVLGHDACGAVSAAVGSDTAPGHLQSVVSAIQPAVATAKTMQGNLLDNAINANVLYVVDKLKQSEPILDHEFEAGHVQIVGARYSLSSGAVQILSK